MQNRFLEKLPFVNPGASIRTLMIYPFVILIAVAITSTSFLSLYNSGKAAEYTAWQLTNEIAARIEDRVLRLLDRAHLVNETNANVIESGQIDLNNMREQKQHFWLQVRFFEYISYAFIGREDGGFFGARRLSDGTLQTIGTETLTGGEIRFFNTDNRGRPTTLSSSLPYYDHKTRPWYKAGIEAGKPTWSPVFIDAGGEGLTITAATPLYDTSRAIKGVLGCSFIFSHINQFLRSLKIGESGLTFIIERSGMLVATSTLDPTYTTDKKRIAALESENTKINQTSKSITEQFGDIGRIDQKQRLSIDVMGEKYFGHLSPLTDHRGIDWFIVVIIPENDFMSPIKDGNFNTVLLSLVALGVTIAVGFTIARRITRPILELNIAARSLADGDWSQELKIERRDEVGELANSFNLMVKHLQITTVSRDRLAEEIEERTKIESELQKLAAVVENSSELVNLATLDGKMVFLNEAGGIMLGIPPCDVENYHILDAVPDELKCKVENEVLPAILKEGRWQGELQYRNLLTGAVIDVHAMAFTIRDSVGAPQYLANVSLDITERKRAEAEKRRLEDRLQRSEKMEALGTMAGGVAHDLNNVLGVVVGFSELLLREVDTSSPIRRKLENIMNGGQRAAAIVQDLLTLTRRGVPGRQVLNLNKIVLDFQQSPEMEKLSSQNSLVRINVDLEEDLLNVSGSSVHLVKTLFNLVSNAIEAMPRGGVLTIKTANQYLDKPIQGYDEIQEGDYVVLSVSDTGEGIPAPDLKRIFEPFYTKKVMGRSGTGLGLAVVWGTVKDLNGYINVQSEEGKESIFTLYFPVTREEISAEHIAVSISKYMGNGESILVVDDVDGQRELAADMLGKLNYSVASVSSGEEAVAHLKEHKVDLVVLDMIMDPGMDGLDTYKSILAIRSGQKAIIVSGFSETRRVNTAQALGAGAYVKKPYVFEKLGMAVRKELDRVT